MKLRIVFRYFSNLGKRLAVQRKELHMQTDLKPEEQVISARLREMKMSGMTEQTF